MSQLSRLEFTLGAGERVDWPVSGTEVTCTGGSYPFLLTTENGSRVALERGLGVPLAPFTMLGVENTAAYAQTIELYIGDVGVRDSRLSVPSDTTVNVNDNGASVSKEGRAFIVPSGVSSGAANYAHHQVWNPVGSGYLAIIKKLEIQSSTASTTFTGAFYESAIGSQANSKNKDSQESNDSIAQHRWLAQSSIISLSTLLWQPYTAGQPVVMEFDRPLIVREGYGFVVVNGTVNQLSRVQFEYELELA